MSGSETFETALDGNIGPEAAGVQMEGRLEGLEDGRLLYGKRMVVGD